uniref:Uncharacterized protein n=1 Tax=Ralstonia solanacearum TaxID=305 RepID=A0A0S4V7M9_RALSL|nr:protein of unknown function [Ralstonia solanacearum]
MSYALAFPGPSRYSFHAPSPVEIVRDDAALNTYQLVSQCICQLPP